jgi:hypothetical protein
MSHASAPQRAAFAERIYVNVKDAARRNETERLPTTTAFFGIDAGAGNRLADELGIDQTVLEADLKRHDEYQDSISGWETKPQSFVSWSQLWRLQARITRSTISLSRFGNHRCAELFLIAKQCQF